MFVLELIGGILLGAAAILVPLYIFYRIFRFLWERFIEPAPAILNYSKTAEGALLNRIGYKNMEVILNDKFRYYQKLDDAGKTKFLKRVSRFIADKEFRALEGLLLTEEMVVLISASAIQLTFGLEDYMLDHFSKIFIYPKEFYSRTSKTYNKGETNIMGVVVLSWKDFQEGYANERDNLNLGLHEMAHALKLDQLHEGLNSAFTEYMNKWQLVAKDEFTKLKEKQSSVFREYGGTNVTEFFSVCVEYFFESPTDLLRHAPEVYKHLTILLNQDPAINGTGAPAAYDFQENELQPEGEPESEFVNLLGVNAWPFLLTPVFITLVCLTAKNHDQSVIPLSIFLGITLVFSFFVIRRNKRALLIYADKVVLSSWYLKKFNLTQSLESLVSLTFIEGPPGSKGGKQPNRIQIAYLQNGKIRHRSYTFELPQNAMVHVKEDMAAKKIPVLFDGFENLQRVPIRRY